MSDDTPPPGTACEHCGATDTELIGITPWTGKPGDPPPYDWYCLDILACYARFEAQHQGLPI